MTNQKVYKFYVIELLEPPPYTNSERYVCAPRSWIKFHETSNNIVEVKFPNGELSEIKELARKEECPNNWTSCEVVIKYSTNSYKDAIEYINILNKITVRQQLENRLKRVNDVPLTSSKRLRKSQTSETCTVSDLMSDAKPVSKGQLNLTNTEIETFKNKSQTVKSSPKPGRCLTTHSARADNTVGLLNQTTEYNGPNTNNCVKENNKTNDSQKDERTIKLAPELMNKLKILVALRSVLGDDYRDKLLDLHNHYETNCLTLKAMLLAFSQNCKNIKTMIELTDKFNNHPDINNLEGIIKKIRIAREKVNANENNSDKVIGSEVEKDAQTEKEKNHNIDMTEVKNNKIRGQSRKFTLPPEYNPKDSRWTLKYRVKKKDLVELAPHSKVYVNAIKLANCKLKSKDCKTLARMLLLEVFSKNALNICSLTGKKANAFDLEGTIDRPGLDEHARNILLNYVKKHGQKQNWAKFDRNIILNTLRNKIQEIRGKQG